MMKKILFILALIALSKLAAAQKETLSLDEHNKYIYYQVNDLPGVSADSLHARGAAYLSKIYPKLKLTGAKSTEPFVVKDKLIVYSSATVAKHEDGEVSYTLNIEVKDSKYRYWLTDFVFKPYQRNRYGSYEPTPGISYALESASKRLNARDLGIYTDQLVKFGKLIGEDLKVYLANPIKQETKPVKVIINKW